LILVKDEAGELLDVWDCQMIQNADVTARKAARSARGTQANSGLFQTSQDAKRFGSELACRSAHPDNCARVLEGFPVHTHHQAAQGAAIIYTQCCSWHWIIVVNNAQVPARIFVDLG